MATTVTGTWLTQEGTGPSQAYNFPSFAQAKREIFEIAKGNCLNGSTCRVKILQDGITVYEAIITNKNGRYHTAILENGEKENIKFLFAGRKFETVWQIEDYIIANRNNYDRRNLCGKPIWMIKNNASRVKIGAYDYDGLTYKDAYKDLFI